MQVGEAECQVQAARSRIGFPNCSSCCWVAGEETPGKFLDSMTIDRDW